MTLNLYAGLLIYCSQNISRVKKLFVILGGIFVLVASIAFYVYKEIPFRTAIFRSFAKGSSYLISEKDTLYGFGYYGVRKWLADSEQVRLLAENDDFMDNCFVGHLVGRSGAINGDYLYVAARSYLGGPDKRNSNNYSNGKLLILRKSDLSIVKEIKSDIKLIELKKHDDFLVVSGLCGFDIYHIAFPDSLEEVFKYRSEKFTEFQGLEIFDKDTSTYVAFARFAEGISIWDISSPAKAYPVCNRAIQDKLGNGCVLPEGLQVFKVELAYPYLYATLGPMKGYFGTSNDRRGLLVYDLSNIDSIQSTVCLIPSGDFYKTKIGDPEPTHLDIYDNILYANFGEKGVAMFDISKPLEPVYKGIIDAGNAGNMILPIHINHKGILFSGDYYWDDIYKKSLH